MAKNPRLIDLTGQRFGDLVVVRQDGNKPGGAAVWLCQCDCGRFSRPIGNDLRKGKVRSCGHDRMAKFHAATRTHGASGTRLHRIWKAMLGRCRDKSNRRYGGRGIRVCGQWASFENFATWAASAGYRADLTIDRINNDGDYTPENCRWADYKTQANNRSIVALSPDGRSWWLVAESNGITRPAFLTRIYDGWSHEQAATWPMFKKRKKAA